MIKIISNNLIAKLICLLLAFSFWTYVVSGEAKIDNFPGKIPLEARNRPENLVVVKDVEEVEIKIITERGSWQKLSTGSFQAYLDLSGLNQGTHELPVNIFSRVAGVQVVEVKPAKIMVSMEPVVTKSVTVRDKIEGNAAEGMMASNIKLEPNKVDISGPESILAQISEAKAVIILDGEESSFNKNIAVKAFNEKNQEYENISFNPKEVEAKITIIKASQTKTVGIKVKTEGRLASGYWINQISLDPSIVTITGSANDLAQVNYLETNPLNIDGLNGNKTQQVNLNLPNNISLAENQSNKTTVEIKTTNLDSSKEIMAGFNYLNLSNSLKISKIEPANITVLLAGSVEELANTDSAKVKVNLDLTSFSKAGTYALDLSSNMISKPDKLTVNSLVPSSVRISLEDK